MGPTWDIIIGMSTGPISRHHHSGFHTFPDQDIEQSLADRFRQVVALYPDTRAVRTRETTLTYRTVDALAIKAAHDLIERGNPTLSVALLFPHGSLMIPAIMGVLSARMFYVPLDPRHPVSRLRHILAHSKCSLLMTTPDMDNLAHSITQDNMPVIHLDTQESDTSYQLSSTLSGGGPNDMAYVLYTSGSTGTPKGISQNNRNVLHHIRAYTNSIRMCSSDRVTLLSSYGFDGAVMDLFGSLLTGATLYPIDPQTATYQLLYEWIRDEAITVFHSTPSVFRYFAEGLRNRDMLQHVRIVVLGGEPVNKRDVDLFRNCFPQSCMLVNGYGPTESTTATQYFVPNGLDIPSSVPIGSPVEGTEVRILDNDLLSVQSGEVGEIVISSPYVALGYWGQPDLTAARFLSEPGTRGSRLFLTGDLGRVGPHGIEYVGRKDSQIKVRGHRVEPAEVEATLLGLAGIQQCVVVSNNSGSPRASLTAYVVPEHDSLDAQSVCHYLEQCLPAYLVPASIVLCGGFPLSPNGKVDLDALERDTAIVNPRKRGSVPNCDDPIELALIQLLADALDTDPNRISREETFFELGGDSLAAMRLLRLIHDRFGATLKLRELFDTPSVIGWTDIIKKRRGLQPSD
jgi:amino acid adenylation domain-containing protein